MMQSGAGPNAQRECSKRDVQKSTDSMTIDFVCTVRGKTLTSHAVVSGSFDSAYTMTVTSQGEGMANDGRTLTMTAKWIGPCTAEQKPGDMIMANGMKFNILNAQKLGAPAAVPLSPRLEWSAMGFNRRKMGGRASTRCGAGSGPPGSPLMRRSSRMLPRIWLDGAAANDQTRHFATTNCRRQINQPLTEGQGFPSACEDCGKGHRSPQTYIGGERTRRHGSVQAQVFGRTNPKFASAMKQP